jgi:hypothetical protein
MYRLVRAQVGRADQETSLRPAAELCGPATFALAQAGHQHEAVNAFERTRAVLLTEALHESRTDVRRLAQDAPALVTRYRAAAERLTQLTRRTDDRLPVRLAGRGIMLTAARDEAGKECVVREGAISRVFVSAGLGWRSAAKA